MYIDGEYAGRTPFAAEVPAGTRRVRLDGEWIERIEETVRGESRTSLSFDPEVTRLGAVKLAGRIPSGARLSIDGRRVSAAGLSSGDGLKLPAGEHTLRITAPTIRPFELPFELGAARVFDINPDPVYRKGRLRVEGLPEGVERLSIGETTFAAGDLEAPVDLVIGRYPVVVANPFGEAFRDTVEIEEGRSIDYEVPVGTLLIEGLPDRMSVEIGGKTAFETGREAGEAAEAAGMRLLPGSYRVRVAGEDASTESFEVTVDRQATVRRKVDIELYGKVAVEPPSGREVEVELVRSDGPNLGVSPGAEKRLPVGEWRVSAKYTDDTHPGLIDRFSVGRGERVTLDLSKLPYSPEYRLSGLEADLARAKGRWTAGWVSLAAGILSAGTSAFAYVTGDAAMAEYAAATNTAAAQAARQRAEAMGRLFTAGASAAGVGISLGPILWLVGDRRAQIEERIGAVKAEIAARSAAGAGE